MQKNQATDNTSTRTVRQGSDRTARRETRKLKNSPTGSVSKEPNRVTTQIARTNDDTLERKRCLTVDRNLHRISRRLFQGSTQKEYVDHGGMNAESAFYNGLPFADGQLQTRPVARPQISLYCAKEKIRFKPAPNSPCVLHSPLTETGTTERQFRQAIRAHNTALSAVSVRTSCVARVHAFWRLILLSL